MQGDNQRFFEDACGSASIKFKIDSLDRCSIVRLKTGFITCGWYCFFEGMNLSSGLLATKVIRNQGRQSLKLVFVQ